MVHPPGWEPPAWQPPAGPTGSEPAGPGGAPSWGCPQDGPWGQPWQPGTPPPVPGGPGTRWAAQQRPGVVPLRPLGLGEILDGSVQTMRHNPRVMFGLSAVLMGLAVVLSTVLMLVGAPQLFGALDPAGGRLDSSAVSGLVSGGIVTLLVPAVIQTLALAVLNGILIVAVSDAVLGRRPSAADVLRRVGRPGALRLLLLSLLTGAITLLVLAAAALPVAGLFWLSTVAGVVGLVVILPALLVVGTVLTVRLALAAPALLLEDLTLTGALRRSWRLTGGSFWRSLGILLLAGIIAGVVSNLLQVPFAIVAQLVALALGSGGDGTLTTGLVALTLVTNLGTVLSAAVVSPFIAAVVSLLYIDLRIRREGLDVALAQAAGTTPA